MASKCYMELLQIAKLFMLMASLSLNPLSWFDQHDNDNDVPMIASGRLGKRWIRIFS